jgi:hypothetical protein
MPFDYEREVRTSQSEAFLILEGEEPVGRIDTHFMPGLAHVAIAVNANLTAEQIEEILSDIDADMLNTVGTEHDTHHFHVFQGNEIRVFSNAGYDDYAGGNGNGRGHGPVPPPTSEN